MRIYGTNCVCDWYWANSDTHKEGWFGLSIPDLLCCVFFCLSLRKPFVSFIRGIQESLSCLMFLVETFLSLSGSLVTLLGTRLEYVHVLFLTQVLIINFQSSVDNETIPINLLSILVGFLLLYPSCLIPLIYIEISFRSAVCRLQHQLLIFSPRLKPKISSFSIRNLSEHQLRIWI